MCTEPDFNLLYRELISWYRLTPQTSARQLQIILARLSDSQTKPWDQNGRRRKAVQTDARRE